MGFFSSLIIGALIFIAVFKILSKMIIDFKNGKSPSCGCDCNNCNKKCH